MNFNRRQALKTAVGMVGTFGMAGTLASPLFFQMARASDGFFEITAKKANIKIHRDDSPASELWTYQGTSPGPEIRVKRGERVRVRLINELDEPTSIHWHGIRIDNSMDGVSGLTQMAVNRAETFEYDFVVPDAGTYWYHAHNKSWNQVARGLYGPLIVEEDEPAFDRDHDLTLVADDWRLDREGVFDTQSLGSLMDWSHAGRLGNWLTVNGRSLPQYKIKADEAYRLRIINACNSRVLEIDPGRFNGRILAYDGQPLTRIQTLDYSPLLIAPAQRVDLLIVGKAGGNFEIEEVSGNQSYDFIKFEVEDGLKDHASIPSLGQNDLPEPDLQRAQTFKLHMSGGAMGRRGDIVYKGKKLEDNDMRETGQIWALNGIANLAKEPFFSVARGQTVSVEIFNDTAFAHAMHTHGHHFRVFEDGNYTTRDGDAWRDTFLIFPGKTKTISFVADNPGKWLLHCHMLEHAAAGMNTWFEVT